MNSVLDNARGLLAPEIETQKHQENRKGNQMLGGQIAYRTKSHESGILFFIVENSETGYFEVRRLKASVDWLKRNRIPNFHASFPRYFERKL